MAYGVPSQKFCCCLPVRIGVFALSFLQFLSAGCLAALGYYTIAQERYDKTVYKTVSIILTVVMTILCIVSLLGTIGVLLRRLPLVRIYSHTLNFLLAINIAGGIASIVILFIKSDQSIRDACIDGSTNQDDIDACNNVDWFRYTAIFLIVFNWLVHLYECVIVARYSQQLQEEKEEKWRLSAMKTYQQVPHRDSTDAFISPPTVYPYTDKDHSYSSHDAAWRNA